MCYRSISWNIDIFFHGIICHIVRKWFYCKNMQMVNKSIIPVAVFKLCSRIIYSATFKYISQYSKNPIFWSNMVSKIWGDQIIILSSTMDITVNFLFPFYYVIVYSLMLMKIFVNSNEWRFIILWQMDSLRVTIILINTVFKQSR